MNTKKLVTTALIIAMGVVSNSLFVPLFLFADRITHENDFFNYYIMKIIFFSVSGGCTDFVCAR